MAFTCTFKIVGQQVGGYGGRQNGELHSLKAPEERVVVQRRRRFSVPARNPLMSAPPEVSAGTGIYIGMTVGIIAITW